MQWIIFRRLEEAIAHREAGKYPISSDILDKTIDELKEILDNAPHWWGDDNKGIYDNLIFVIPPLSSKDVYDEIGDPKAEYEKIHSYNNAIFWSFIRKDYRKTNWWPKTASSDVSQKITIRTANKVRKIVNK